MHSSSSTAIVWYITWPSHHGVWLNMFKPLSSVFISYRMEWFFGLCIVFVSLCVNSLYSRLIIIYLTTPVSPIVYHSHCFHNHKCVISEQLTWTFFLMTDSLFVSCVFRIQQSSRRLQSNTELLKPDFSNLWRLPVPETSYKTGFYTQCFSSVYVCNKGQFVNIGLVPKSFLFLMIFLCSI